MVESRDDSNPNTSSKIVDPYRCTELGNRNPNSIGWGEAFKQGQFLTRETPESKPNSSAIEVEEIVKVGDGKKKNDLPI
ncbi:hypothetical protein [Wolbachia endosymbiont of Ctenocephalides felis wCfeT]|uniref:hypothetical protein n=1 Tax=Wolbachia endosymbiont of Ctenocephalides felis wCfeT TaxID=2732593 RepID=UPI001445BACE|nr:hypothetical protein [Wolbachia endosymbiont of Ctenocephalides felis wCfeT]